MDSVLLHIEPTTGGSFELRIKPSDSVEELKSTIAKKFRLTKEQIILLWRESKLESGTIASNSLHDGSRIRLVPCIETGLVAPRPDESTVLEALNSLNEGQVNEFLSGQSPLNLTMRLGEHVMLIQLQLTRTTTTDNQDEPVGTSDSSSNDSKTEQDLDIDDDESELTSGSSQETENNELYVSEAQIRQNSNEALMDQQSTDIEIFEETSLSEEVSDQLTNVETMQKPKATYGSVNPFNGQNVKHFSISGNPDDSLNLHKQSDMPSFNTTKHKIQQTEPRPCHSKSISAPSLASASRHLTETLKKLSSTVKTSEPKVLQHHGRGVYSGTFSGTLSPCLQDGDGRPHEHVSTIVHILNDLLGTMDVTASSSTNHPHLTTFCQTKPLSHTKKRQAVLPQKTTPPVKKPKQVVRSTEEENAIMRAKLESIKSRLLELKQAKK